MENMNPKRYFDLNLEDCISVFDALDELIITDADGYIRYISPQVIKAIETLFHQDEKQVYVGRHITEVNPTTLMEGFIKRHEDEKNVFHLANNLATVTRFKKVKEGGRLKFTLDYDLFRDEEQLKKFLLEVIQLDNSDILSLSETIEEIRCRIKESIEPKVSVHSIIGNSPQMERLKKKIYSISHSTATVLICGETGTGKELFAQAIHAASPRSRRQLIEVNSAAIPENLFESEMFGYEDGAFTGAKKGGMLGKFELANKGTLFLDEIDQIPYHIQPKLLRALQEKCIDKIGANNVPVDVRLIASTNKNLKQLVKEEKFREDLYYRLNVITMDIPPLREHKEDIPILVTHFINVFNESYHKTIKQMAPDAMQILFNYHWPGNVRELRNMVERAMVVAQTEVLQAEEFQDILKEPPNADRSYPTGTLEQVRTRAEKEAIAAVLERAQNKSKAAEILGITRPALYYKMDKYGL